MREPVLPACSARVDLLDVLDSSASKRETDHAGKIESHFSTRGAGPDDVPEDCGDGIEIYGRERVALRMDARRHNGRDLSSTTLTHRGGRRFDHSRGEATPTGVRRGDDTTVARQPDERAVRAEDTKGRLGVFGDECVGVFQSRVAPLSDRDDPAAMDLMDEGPWPVKDRFVERLAWRVTTQGDRTRVTIRARRKHYPRATGERELERGDGS